MVNSGDTAWVLVSAAMVLLMTPGLALFYGGMVRSSSVLNMMMMSMGALGLVTVLWVLYGYSLAFGQDVRGGLLGDPLQFAGLRGLMQATMPGGGLPTMAFVGFQCVFAVLTVALISGAVADRARFGGWMVFAGLWVTLVYFPVAHWVFDLTVPAVPGPGGAAGAAHEGGWIVGRLHVVDFAGGTAVHVNAGAAGLALALVLGRRIGFGREAMRPHNLTLVMVGAGLLWFGWFGFNAGSALAAGTTAAVVFVNTIAATAAAMLTWLGTERVRDGRPTSLGAASGVVAGLVAITPACSAVSPVGALLLGAGAGVLCALAVGLKHRFGVDDSLDVVGVHLVGGLWGTLAVGLLATSAAPAGVDGLLHGGGPGQLGRQVVGALAVLVFSFSVTWLVATVLERTVGLRVSADVERAGIDLGEHAERGYDLLGVVRQPDRRHAGAGSGVAEHWTLAEGRAVHRADRAASSAPLTVTAHRSGRAAQDGGDVEPAK